MRLTLKECFIWARLIVRTCEDMEIDGTVLHAAKDAQSEIEEMLKNPGFDGRPWIRCSIPTLSDWRDQALKRDKPERARAYEAVIAVRRLAGEAVS